MHGKELSENIILFTDGAQTPGEGESSSSTLFPNSESPSSIESTPAIKDKPQLTKRTWTCMASNQKNK